MFPVTCLTVTLAVILATLQICLAIGGDTIPKVVIDLHSTKPYTLYTENKTVSLNSTLILECNLIGVEYGTEYMLSWECPNGEECELGSGNLAARNVAERFLAINVISISLSGNYVCRARTLNGSEIASGSYLLQVKGGQAYHSNNQLIPQSGIFRVSGFDEQSGDSPSPVHCSSPEASQVHWVEISDMPSVEVEPLEGVARFSISQPALYTGGKFLCIADDYTLSFLYVFTERSSPLAIPQITSLAYSAEKGISFSWLPIAAVDTYIFSYRQTGHANSNIPAVYNDRQTASLTSAIIPTTELFPGVEYEIRLWATRTRDTANAYISPPHVRTITIPEQVPSEPRELTVTRELANNTGFEVTWLPPLHPNGRVTYVIEYSEEENFPLEGTGRVEVTQNSSTFANLTNLDENVLYFVRVVSVNSAGRMEGDPMALKVESVEEMSGQTGGSVVPTGSLITPTGSETIPTGSTVSPTGSVEATPSSIVTRGAQESMKAVSQTDLAVYIAVPVGILLIGLVAIAIILMVVIVYRNRNHGNQKNFIAGSESEPQDDNVLQNTLGSQYSERGVDVSEDSSIVPRPPAQELPDIAQSAEEGNSLQRTHINVSTESSRTERFPYTWNSNVSSSQQEAKKHQDDDLEDLYSKPDKTIKRPPSPDDSFDQEDENGDSSQSQQKALCSRDSIGSDGLWDDVPGYARPWSIG